MQLLPYHELHLPVVDASSTLRPVCEHSELRPLSLVPEEESAVDRIIISRHGLILLP